MEAYNLIIRSNKITVNLVQKTCIIGGLINGDFAYILWQIMLDVSEFGDKQRERKCVLENAESCEKYVYNVGVQVSFSFLAVKEKTTKAILMAYADKAY